ncbi:MAG: hypothetical protein MUF72_04015 [Elainella sp. Prado103]|jgi:hypothetical protein|nr:hypothetical protein [Elainella sp. Prado103]
MIQSFKTIHSTSLYLSFMRFNLLAHLQQQPQISWATCHQLITVISLLACLLNSSGCASLRQLNPATTSSAIDLSISRVVPTSSGRYLVTGRTTLPDQTRLTVMAIRSFQSTNPEAEQSSYVILDRQIVEVNETTWTANLGLWKPAAPTGQPQEAWQQTPDYGKMKPEQSVTFVVTAMATAEMVTAKMMPDLSSQPSESHSPIRTLDSTSQNPLLRYTPEGDPYLQASTQLSIAPPIGAPLPTLSSSPRSIPSIQATTAAEQVIPQPHTDLPLKTEAFLR